MLLVAAVGSGRSAFCRHPHAWISLGFANVFGRRCRNRSLCPMDPCPDPLASSRVMLFVNLIPLTTVLWGWLIFEHKVEASFWWAMILVMMGVLIGWVDFRPRRSGRLSPLRPWPGYRRLTKACSLRNDRRSPMNDSLPSIIHAIEKIMRHEGLHEERIRSFLRDVGRIAEGELSLIREASIAPIHDLPEINAGEESNDECSERLKQLAVIKLNGGLGTGMGLNKAKSLVPVKNGLTFLDLIARQMGHLQKGQGTGPGFCLMNSFSTQKDTVDWLNRHVLVWQGEQS